MMPVPRSRKIDLDSWARSEHFAFYRDSLPCTYSVTVELDVTRMVEAVRQTGVRLYIAQIWALSTIVNEHDEFKMFLGENSEPRVWETVHPSFTVFNKRTETFANIWAEYNHDFSTFHEAALTRMNSERSETQMFPMGDPPANVFNVSSLPWTNFSAFNLNVNTWDHLSPIVTLGRHVEKSTQLCMPLAFQVHHAAADGFHVGRFITELQTLFDDCTWLSAKEI
nr:CatA-like O-acetyltransferase [Leucobacter chinensis]